MKGKGKGGVLPFDGTAAVTVQLSNSDNSNCWQSTFTSFKKNVDAQFKATAP